MSGVPHAGRHWSSRLPFYYGWVIIGVAFVTMAIGVSARTAFSLLMPPVIAEFGWDRGFVAGAFSFGLLVSAALSPVAGMGCCAASAAAIWIAAPRTIRVRPGQCRPGAQHVPVSCSSSGGAEVDAAALRPATGSEFAGCSLLERRDAKCGAAGAGVLRPARLQRRRYEGRGRPG